MSQLILCLPQVARAAQPPPTARNVRLRWVALPSLVLALGCAGLPASPATVAQVRAEATAWIEGEAALQASLPETVEPALRATPKRCDASTADRVAAHPKVVLAPAWDTSRVQYRKDDFVKLKLETSLRSLDGWPSGDTVEDARARISDVLKGQDLSAPVVVVLITTAKQGQVQGRLYEPGVASGVAYVWDPTPASVLCSVPFRAWNARSMEVALSGRNTDARLASRATSDLDADLWEQASKAAFAQLHLPLPDAKRLPGGGTHLYGPPGGE